MDISCKDPRVSSESRLHMLQRCLSRPRIRQSRANFFDPMIVPDADGAARDSRLDVKAAVPPYYVLRRSIGLVMRPFESSARGRTLLATRPQLNHEVIWMV